jgi:molybdate transport system substrate-binding protein
MSLAAKIVPLVFAFVLISPGATASGEIKVMTSGAFTAAYLEIIPQFERATGKKIDTSFGASMGNAPDSIPRRLQRGEPVDVVILARPALDDLIKQGKIIAGTDIDLVRSRIGMAVRAGTKKPDVSSVQALRRTLLNAKSRIPTAPAAFISLPSYFNVWGSPTR